MKMTDQELAEVYGGPLEEKPSLFANLEEGLAKSPDDIASIAMHQRAGHLSQLVSQSRDWQSDQSDSGECLKLTFRQIHTAALKFAAALMANGVHPGMRIATLVPNRIEWPLTFWMTTVLRLTLCSLDPGYLDPPRREDLSKVLATLQPDAVVVLDDEAARGLDSIYTRSSSSNISKPKVKIVLEPSSSRSNLTDWTSFLDLVSSASMFKSDEERLLHDARNDDPDRIALIIFTSGTSSGNPKGCPRSVRSVCFNLKSQVYGVRGFHQDTRLLQYTANFRMIAPSLTLHVWRAGGTAIIPDPKSGVKGTIAAIREHKLTFVLFIPALLHAFAADPEVQSGRLDVSSIEDIQLGGEICTRDIMLKAVRTFPQARICNGHGMSEGQGLFNWAFHNVPYSEIPYLNDICPVGVVARGARLRIIDPATEQVLKRGEIGELLVCAPSLIKRYLNDAFPETFLTDPQTGMQWFKTGDLALSTSSPENYVYIVGRAKDRIKRAGIPILPAALENCVEKFLGVQSVVLAWPHPELGEEPLAVVQRFVDGKRDKEVKEEVVQMFGKDYALGRVVSLEMLGLETFPLNATGKVMKTELMASVKELLGR